MKSYFTKKEQIVILIVVGIIVSIVGYKFFFSKILADKRIKNDIVINADKLDNKNIAEDDKDVEVNQEKENAEQIHIAQIPQENIIVHISGQVKNPGIVELENGQRLIDAVEFLGGLTDQADGDRINLAKKLQDEEKIYIPKIGEELSPELALIQTPTTSDQVQTFASKDSGADVSGKLDINTCSKDLLNTLPGIGEVLSNRIIEYRETNLFKTIEDIMNVSGIGAKKFEGIKELIIVK
nr:helix-hairpin-helix domain-containing protein [Tissierella sp.]